MADFSREKAVNLLNTYIKSPHVFGHSYALEAVMRALARKLSPGEEELWAMAGLLHDLDYDLVDWKSDLSLHGFKTVEILKQENFGDEEMYHAILAHNAETGTEIRSPLDRAIFDADPITGFIVAIAKVYPDQKITSVKVKSIIKRMGELRFAASVNRYAMKSIEQLNIPFPEFAELSLAAMVEIADVLEL